MKAVLISICPKWCELIARGEKTIEVRKTRPKVETPFKCYIYETKSKTELPYIDEKYNHIADRIRWHWKGKVIGEFMCDEVLEYPYIDDGYSSGGDYLTIIRDGYIKMCLEQNELLSYGDGKTLYGWPISNLKIYDKPKELKEFMRPCMYGEESEHSCFQCEKSGFAPDMNLFCYNVVKHPPQSWCYVEEII